MSTSAEDRLALARKLASLEGRRKVDALLESADPAALVRSLPAEDLYFTIKEAGLADAGELVALASPEQFRAFLDLDCWRRDAFDPRAPLAWLRAASERPASFKRKLKALDLEVVELVLRSTVAIWDLEEDPDREPAGNPWRSPEGRYLVDLQVDGDDLVAVRRLLDALYEEDPLQAVRFLEAVRWELASDLEEEALRWRTARLADMGFPELERALALYTYVDPDAPLAGGGRVPEEPAGFFLATLGGELFLDQVLARLQPEELGGVDRELLAVLNGALVAEGIDPGRLGEVRRALAGARDHLSLGLEHAAQGDAARGAELLLSASIARIFQVASGLTLRRKFRADRIAAQGHAGFPGSKQSWFDAPVGLMLDALRRRRPQLNQALEGPRAPTSLRPFRSRRDLALADEGLDVAEILARLVGKLGIDPAQAGQAARQARGELFDAVRLSDLLIHLALQGRGEAVRAIRPLRLGEVPPALAWALESPSRLSPAFETALRGPLLGAAREGQEQAVARDLADFALRKALEALGPARAQSGRLDAPSASALPILVIAVP